MVVPSDWKFEEIGKHISIGSGASPSQFNIGYGEMPYFKVEQLNNSTKYQIDTPYKVHAEKGIPKDSIIFAKRGAAIASNKVRILAVESLFDTNIMSITLIDDVFDLEYLFYWLIRYNLWNIADTTSVPQINNKHIKPLEVLTPPLPEQHRIAEALSDMDSYINSLEKLIDKKRAIKQGTMQELLTGKRRLEGFKGEWGNINLVANSTLKARIGWQGLTTAEYLDEGDAYLITGTDFVGGKIAWETCHYVDRYRYDQDTNIQVRNGDVLITKDGTIGKVAIVSGLSKKATLNSGVFVLRPKSNAYDSRYVYYILLSQVFIEFLDKLAAGSTINHLYQKDFVNFEFDIPSDIAEQTAIAQILSDMDAEIDTLTTKLTKLKNIKQGMMSELLTGRIRLKGDAQSGKN